MKKTEIQEKHLTLINHAVEEAFEKVEWRPLEVLTRGLSASALFRIQIDHEDYVARLDDPQNSHNNLAREYHAMNLAAQHKIAPKLYYVDPKSGVALMKFIHTQPLKKEDFCNQHHINALAQLVRGLHDCGKFKDDISVFQRVDAVYKMLSKEFQNSKIITQCISIKEQLEKYLSDKNDTKPCHCDINPYNLLFDGNQFWLVDWNAASQQNFYFDLACCGVFYYFSNVDASDKFLHAYFSRKLTAAEKSKYQFMKVFVSIYFGTYVYLSERFAKFPLLSDEKLIHCRTMRNLWR